MKLLVLGKRWSTYSWWYSNPLFTRNASAQARVSAMKIRPHFRFPRRRLAHARTTVTDEAMRMNVLAVASGTLRNSQPRGHTGALVRIRMYDEKSAPNSITSEARNSQ